MKKNIRFDFSSMAPVDISQERLHAAEAISSLEEKRPLHGWRMPNVRSCTDLSALQAEARHINENFEAFVVVGIGGSTMGSTSLPH